MIERITEPLQGAYEVCKYSIADIVVNLTRAYKGHANKEHANKEHADERYPALATAGEIAVASLSAAVDAIRYSRSDRQ